LNGSYISRGGSFDADGDRRPADPLGAQGGLADTDTYNILAKIGLEPADGSQRLQLSVNRYSLEQDSDFAGISFAGDPDNNIRTPAVRGDFNPENPATDTTNLNLEYRHEDLLNSVLNTQLYYADNEVIFGKFPGFSQTKIESEKIGVRLTIDTPLFSTSPVPLSLVWGVDYLRDDTRQTATDGPTTSPRLEQYAVAGFFQLEADFGDAAIVRGGLRHEVISVDVSDFTRDEGDFVRGGTLDFDETLFNLSATYFINDQVDIYGGYSEGFTIAEIGRSISDGTFADSRQAESEAQRTENHEIGIRFYSERWNAALIGFFSDSNNGTTFDQDLNIVKQPEEIYGVEASLNVDLSDRWGVGGTLTYLEGEVDLDNDGDFDEDLPSTRIPPLKLTTYVEYAPNDWSNYRLQGLYSGDRDVDSTQFGGTSDIDSYFITDALAVLELGPGTLEVGIENLFNEDYTPLINQAYDLNFAYVRGPGRTISLAYGLEF
jgi:iron complex outermembrane receptor protein